MFSVTRTEPSGCTSAATVALGRSKLLAFASAPLAVLGSAFLVSLCSCWSCPGPDFWAAQATHIIAANSRTKCERTSLPFPRATIIPAWPPPRSDATSGSKPLYPTPLPQERPVGVLAGEGELAVLLIDRSLSVTLCRPIKATQEVSR